MSAAAPRPPSGLPANTMNGLTNGALGIVGADGWRGSDGAGDSRGAAGPYPSIAEIIASATDTAEALRHHSVYAEGPLSIWQSLTTRRYDICSNKLEATLVQQRTC
jgi:hypothetical protein